MQTLSNVSETPRDLDLELALLLDDPQWVREEFEVLMAAEWPQRVPRRPSARTATGPDPRGDGARLERDGRFRKPPSRGHAPGTDGWVRERSPPR